MERNLSIRIAAKLYNEGLLCEEYTRAKAEQILDRCVAPVMLKNFLAHNEAEVLHHLKDMETRNELSFNKRLELAGIETIREGSIAFLKHGNTIIERPSVHKIEIVCEQEFGILI